MLAACAKDRPFAPGPHLQLVNAYDLAPPAGVIDEQGRAQYRIGPFDKLSIKVFRVPDLSQSVTVDGSGFVSLPLAGRLEASGKTLPEFEQEVAAALRRNYVRDPQVSVGVDQAVSQTITVDGEVGAPGVYPIIGKMSLLQSIATARGTTEYSKLHDVVVFRDVGNQKMAGLYDLDAIRRGVYPDPTIYAGDKIVVGDSPARRRFKDILAGSTLITTPIIALIQTL